MNSVPNIPISLLLVSLAPVALVLLLEQKWSLDYKEGIYAVLRMLAQLLAIGYVLGFIFNTNDPLIILLVLLLMVAASSWIALRTIKPRRVKLLPAAFFSILLCGGLTLALVTQIVLDIDPWFRPQFVIPLGGMIFAYSMNAISLGADRYYSELDNGAQHENARSTAYRAALIPVTNSFFAVGLVLIPGMMTGQILSGVDPLIAARYQIMVMAMVFGAGGLSSACFLYLVGRQREAVPPAKT
jgi:putative ABC transport system permease protein